MASEEFDQYFRTILSLSDRKYFQSICSWCGAESHKRNLSRLSSWEISHNCPALQRQAA